MPTTESTVIGMVPRTTSWPKPGPWHFKPAGVDNPWWDYLYVLWLEDQIEVNWIGCQLESVGELPF